jgi:hypothetical protein
MPDILIQAETLTFADDLRTALAAVWPEARFHLDPQQKHDLVLHIGGSQPDAAHPVLWIQAERPTATTDTGLVSLMAPVRLQQVLQRLKDLAARPVVHRWRDHQLDTARRLWQAPHTEPVSLTEKEVALLVYLGQSYPKSVTRDDLLRDVWNYAAGADTHTVETHLYRLRQKIEADPDQPAIVVNNGEGYILGILV